MDWNHEQGLRSQSGHTPTCRVLTRRHVGQANGAKEARFWCVPGSVPSDFRGSSPDLSSTGSTYSLTNEAQ